VRQQTAGNDNGIVAKTDNIAEAKKCREGVYLQDHPGFSARLSIKGMNRKVMTSFHSLTPMARNS